MTLATLPAPSRHRRNANTAPRKQSGTGLGLPVTKALVDANRARLVLTSEPGVGTSADVIFPKPPFVTVHTPPLTGRFTPIAPTLAPILAPATQRYSRSIRYPM